MLPWLASTPACACAVQAMEGVIGPDWRAQLADPAQRQHNAFAQPLITGTALAAWAALQPLLPMAPAVMAGYSVGEMAALAACEMLSVPSAIALAEQRANAMTRCVVQYETGLLSVSGLRRETVDAVCAGLHIRLELAIDLGIDQGIYAGTAEHLQTANLAPAGLTAAGALCKPLAISLASHSHWMADAVGPLAAVLADLPWQAPNVPLALNATGALSRQIPVIRDAMAAQIAQTVQWAACMDAIQERGVCCVLEVGGGNALATLWNRRFPQTPARALDDFQHPLGAARWISAAHER